MKPLKLLACEYLVKSLLWNSQSPAITYNRRHIGLKYHYKHRECQRLFRCCLVVAQYGSLTQRQIKAFTAAFTYLLSVYMVTYPSATTLDFQNPTKVSREQVDPLPQTSREKDANIPLYTASCSSNRYK